MWGTITSLVFDSPVTSSLVLLFSAAVAYLFWKDQTFKFYFGDVPSPPALPIVGNSLNFVGPLESNLNFIKL